MDMHLPMLEDFKHMLVDRVRSHPFLVRCRAGEATLPELKLFLVQQGLYSAYFTRYLCALMANLPDNELVLELAENLCEELGLTEDSPTPHSHMYRQMLQSLGLSLDGAKPLVGTRRLIDAMFDHCRDAKVARGLGALCLGAEALVPGVYSDLLAGFSAHGVPASDLEFFRVHVECDDGHAETMRDIMVDLVRRDPEQAPLMLAGGKALVDARLDFFDSIVAQVRAQAAATPAAVPA